MHKLPNLSKYFQYQGLNICANYCKESTIANFVLKDLDSIFNPYLDNMCVVGLFQHSECLCEIIRSRKLRITDSRTNTWKMVLQITSYL